MKRPYRLTGNPDAPKRGNAVSVAGIAGENDRSVIDQLPCETPARGAAIRGYAYTHGL